MNIFGLNPVVVFGTDEQKKRMLPPLIRGEEKACFAVTEPDAGLNTTKLKTARRARGDRYVLQRHRRSGSRPRRSPTKMLILARTTPLEAVAKPTDGSKLFYTDLDRRYRRSARDREDGPQARSTRTCCSSTTCRCRLPTASAKKARASTISCTG